MKFSALGTWFRLPESSLSQTEQPCEKSRHKSRWASSWWKPIVRISHPFRFAESAASPRTRGWSLNRLPARGELLSKKLLALRPQPRKSSSDSTARKDRHEQDRPVSRPKGSRLAQSAGSPSSFVWSLSCKASAAIEGAARRWRVRRHFYSSNLFADGRGSYRLVRRASRHTTSGCHQCARTEVGAAGKRQTGRHVSGFDIKILPRRSARKLW